MVGFRNTDYVGCSFSSSSLKLFLISFAVLKGDVGCSIIIIILSKYCPRFSNVSTTSLTTSQEPAVSDEFFSDLRNDASAPCFSAISAYWGESVETKIVWKHSLSCAAFMNLIYVQQLVCGKGLSRTFVASITCSIRTTLQLSLKNSICLRNRPTSNPLIPGYRLCFKSLA